MTYLYWSFLNLITLSIIFWLHKRSFRYKLSTLWTLQNEMTTFEQKLGKMLPFSMKCSKRSPKKSKKTVHDSCPGNIQKMKQKLTEELIFGPKVNSALLYSWDCFFFSSLRRMQQTSNSQFKLNLFHLTAWLSIMSGKKKTTKKNKHNNLSAHCVCVLIRIMTNLSIFNRLKIQKSYTFSQAINQLWSRTLRITVLHGCVLALGHFSHRAVPSKCF